MSGPLPLDGTVAVVGASLAGLRAAETLREGGFAGRLVMVGDEPHAPYDRPPLSKQVLAGTWPPERTTLADGVALEGLGIEARLGRRAASLDASARRLTLDDGAQLDADGIVIATGASPRRLRGTDSRDDVLVLRTLEDAGRLRAALETARSATSTAACKVAVVGAGFIGAEVAATCAGLGCEVILLEALQTPLGPALGELVGASCGALHVRHGVELRTGAQVAAIDPAPASGTGRQTVHLVRGSPVDADVVVVGIGVVANTGWLEGSGLRVDDGVLCEATLFAADGIVAAGDVARWTWRHHGEEELVRIEHWEVASQMGVAAARGLLAGRAAAVPFDPVPYFWSDQYGLRIQVLGHPSPGDDVAVVDGRLDAEESKFVAIYGRAGRLTAALAVSRPRQLMAFRPLLAAGATFTQARKLLEA